MDQVLQALGALLAATLTAAVPPLIGALRAWAEDKARSAAAALQAQLGEAAGRVAGEIAATVKADPDVQHATEDMVALGARALAARFAETVAAHGIPTDTLAGMVRGELGKLGVGLVR